MAVRITSTGIRFDQLKLVDAGVMRELGKMAIVEILLQTEKGRDYQGRPFKAYSESYADRKEKYRAGSKGIAIGSGTVNLRATGGMLNGMQILSTTPRRAVLGFINRRTTGPTSGELAFYHVESGAGKSHVIRDFFGLTQRFLDDAVARVKKSWR